MSVSKLYADGSAVADRHETVRVDRDEEPWRWRCPNGHTSWDRTNNHVWCPECRRANEAGADVHPEHYEIVDARNDRTIPYSAVEFAGTL